MKKRFERPLALGPRSTALFARAHRIIDEAGEQSKEEKVHVILPHLPLPAKKTDWVAEWETKNGQR